MERGLCRPIVAALALLPTSALPAQESPAAPSPSEVIVAAGAEEWRRPSPEETLYIELEGGRVVVELAPDFAPRHVAQMKALAREGFYDGLEFYRVVEGFVAQGGDLEGEREVKTTRRTVPAELDRPWSATLAYTPLGAADGYAPEVGYVAGFPVGRDPEAGRAWMVHCPGAVAMARDVDPDSGGTEFYVVLGHAPRYLDRNLSVFGRVLAGQDLLQKLNRGAPGLGMIEDPADRGRIVGVRVAADLPTEERTELEVMRTETPSFRALIAARRNRPEAFFVHRPDFIDVCAVPIPVREAPAAP
jgi:peptidylprolyl isomerase